MPFLGLSKDIILQREQNYMPFSGLSNDIHYKKNKVEKRIDRCGSH